MLPMYMTTIPRPVSRILFPLIASYASCPYMTSCEMFLSSKLTRPWHPCCRWQAVLYCSGHLFFPITLAVITPHIAQAKASDQHSDSSPPALAGAGEEQRTWDTIYYMLHLGSPWCSNLPSNICWHHKPNTSSECQGPLGSAPHSELIKKFL